MIDNSFQADYVAKKGTSQKSERGPINKSTNHKKSE